MTEQQAREWSKRRLEAFNAHDGVVANYNG